MNIPTVGSIVEVTTKYKSHLLGVDFNYHTTKGKVVRSTSFDDPTTFRVNTGNKFVPVIDIRNVHELKYITGEGMSVDTTVKTWEVVGSKGDVYTVSSTGDGSYTCTCVAFQFRRKCKHIDKVKSESKS